MKDTTKKIINAISAGVLVLLGACSGGVPSLNELFVAFIAGCIVAVTQFREFFFGVEQTKGKKASVKLFNFLNL